MKPRQYKVAEVESAVVLSEMVGIEAIRLPGEVTVCRDFAVIRYRIRRLTSLLGLNSPSMPLEPFRARA